MPRIGKNIYKRKDGRFEGRYMKGRKENGKPDYGYVYGSTYKESERKLELAQANHAALPEPDVITVLHWLKKWLATAAVFISAPTHDRYASVITEYISPALGECRLMAIDGVVINRFISDSGLPKSTRMDIVSIMKSAMKLAQIEYGITGVADSIAEVTREKSKERTLTKEEQERLTSVSLHRGAKLDIGILLVLYAGLRGGELCALRWEDIDLQECVIRITKSVRRIHNPDQNTGKKTKVIIDTPEFKSAVRDVPITGLLLEFLLSRSGFYRPKDYILTGRPDKYIERRRVKYHLTKRMKSIRLEGVSLRNLRYTFESECFAAGLDLQVLNEILGREISYHSPAALPRPSTSQRRESIERLAKSQASRNSLDVRYG